MMLLQIRVGPSAIHGLGLFAVEAAPRGTPVWRFEPGFDRVFTVARMVAFPEGARAHLRWFAFFSRDDGSATLSGDHSCFMNHSPTPNTGAPPDATSPVTTVALRDIAAGEELTCDYFAFDADAARKLGTA
jgi:SET domain-containing protein